eukprot:10255387-Heterocapsa_arctica.AAC.1
MADSKLESDCGMDILGSLDYFAGEPQKEKNRKRKAAFQERKTDMVVIVLQTEMGNVCIQFQNVDDYHNRQEKTCTNPGGCL